MDRARSIGLAVLWVLTLYIPMGWTQTPAQVEGPNRPPASANDPAASSMRVQLQADLEARINRLKAEHKGLISELQAILELASAEKASKTADRLKALIATRQRQYEKDLASLENRLNRLKKALSESDKKELLTRRAGTSGPLFSLTDQDGKTVRLSDYKGKVVVLEWIDPNCPFWRHLAQRGTLKQIAERYKDKGLVWLAINSCSWSNRRQNQRVATRFELPYPILDDHTGRTAKEYMATNTPYVVIIGADGRIVYNGAVDNAPLGRVQGPVINYVDKALTELFEGKEITITYARPYGTPITANR